MGDVVVNAVSITLNITDVTVHNANASTITRRAFLASFVSFLVTEFAPSRLD